MMSLLSRPWRPVRLRLARLRAQVYDRWRGETTDSYFDFHDAAVLNATLCSLDLPPLSLDPADPARDVAGAARFVLALLLKQHGHYHRRFPTALSDGASGGFAEQVHHLARRMHLSAEARRNLHAAFAGNLVARGQRVYEYRIDLRQQFPDALTPMGRGRYLRWLLEHGRDELQLSVEDILWFLFCQHEDPSAGLATTYLLQPTWQAAHPFGLTVFGWESLKAWLGEKYGFQGRWFHRAIPPTQLTPWSQLEVLQQSYPDLPLPAVAEQRMQVFARWLARQRLPRPGRAWWRALRRELRSGCSDRPGVNVLGHFRYVSGLREAALGVVDALATQPIRLTTRDIPVIYPTDWTDTRRYLGLEQFNTSIINLAINTDIEPHVVRGGLRLREGVYRIAIWYWELSRIPEAWRSKAELLQEIWAPSRFVADALCEVMPCPVLPMLPGLRLTPFVPLGKEAFGLDPARFTFLFLFDMLSILERKNPLGLIDAFRQAFHPAEPVQLVIKVARGSERPADLARLQAAADQAGVILLDQVLSRAEVLALLDASDAYVSLHRSEGLGLSLAEAMLLGKPTIATAYSGNLDFMTADNSLLVDYQLLPLNQDYEPYPRDCHWADPDLAMAAQHLRWVFDHPEEACALGLRARGQVQRILDPIAAGERMFTRLQAIQQTTPTRFVG